MGGDGVGIGMGVESGDRDGDGDGYGKLPDFLTSRPQRIVQSLCFRFHGRGHLKFFLSERVTQMSLQVFVGRALSLDAEGSMENSCSPTHFNRDIHAM